MPLLPTKCIKPLANPCHVTNMVLAVTSGRRLIFGWASWHHPHPSVTQKVAQLAASCCSTLADTIRWYGEEQVSDVLAASTTAPDTASQAPREVLHCSPMWGLLMDCGSLVPGILGNLPSQSRAGTGLPGKWGDPTVLGFLFCALQLFPAQLPAPTASQVPATGQSRWTYCP